MPDLEVSTLDYSIVGLYVLVILGIGFWAGRKKENSEGYFLAGRSTIWPLVGFALMSANLSGTSYIGLAGAGYHDGIAVWNYEWMATLVLVFFTLFILPFYLRSKVNTMPEFLECRYDRRSRYAFSAFSVFTAMFIDSAGALFAGGITLHLLFPEVPLWILIVIIAALGGAYVVLGGLRAVVVTDTIQGVLLLTAGGIIFYFVFQELGSWSAVRAAAPEDGFSVIKPADDDFLPWPGIFTGVLWLGFYYWTTNHIVVQKVLSAKSIDHGRWGALFAGFLQLPLLFLLVLPGTMGREIFPELDDPDQIWPALVFGYLPDGLRGLAFAALVAALMSTLDSVLNGASSLVVNDFIKTRKRQFNEKTLLLISRLMVVVFMVVAALWAPVILQFQGIVEYFQSFLGYITMPVVVVFLGGLFWWRGTRHGAFWTLVIGTPLGLLGFLGGEIFEWFDLQFLYGAGIMLAFSTALYVGISLATEAPDAEKVKGYIWTRKTWQEESQELAGTAWWRNYRYLSAGLVAVTIVLVGLFV
ncbi:sodium/solute symporter [Telmatospirillum sp. J64-1]|uniref:sodium:solute symporter family transporter n=1 Tax=Telmatospirillum sp. J64-1 TaxID=2502183 RepID=UPI00115F1C94|nr:sodium/solute symporter [Telmatospirillum sp. J64-1]